MMLLTKTNREALISNHEANAKTIAVNGSITDFKPVVKLFNPCGIGTWLLTELDPETNIAFGLCELFEAELGYVSIDELANLRVGFGLGIERDLHWTATKTLSEYAKNGGY